MVGQEVGPDLRGVERVRSADMDRTLAFRAALIARQGHARFLVELAVGRRFVTAMDEEELHVRGFKFRAGPHEAVPDPGGPGQHAAPGQRVFQRFHDQAQAPGLLVQGDRLVDPPVHPGGIVVAVVLANARQRVRHLDAVRAQ